MSSSDDDDARQFENMESHDLDGDYEGGQMIDGEYFYANKRRRRARTKEEQIYGVFGDDSEDEREERRRAPRGGPADYSKPVAFTSSATAANAEAPPPPPKKESMFSDDDDDDDDAGAANNPNDPPSRGGLGLGASARGGIGAGGGGGGGGGGGIGFGGFKRGGVVDQTLDDRADARAGLGARAGGIGAGLGLGFGGDHRGGGGGGGGGGLGFAGPASDDRDDDDDDDARAPMREEYSEDDSDEDLLPSTFGQRVMQGAAQRRKEQEEARQRAKDEERERADARARGDAAGGGRGGGFDAADDTASGFAGTRSKVDNKIGEFEKYTKGIGMKLLEKMGYKKGGGLGKDGSGMTAPMETQMRPKTMGMGFGDFKEAGQLNRAKGSKAAEAVARKKARDAGAEEEDLEDAAENEARRKRAEKETRERAMWKKRDDLRRARREYRTAEEVLAEQEKADAAAARAAAAGVPVDRGSHAAHRPKMTIIDMRGGGGARVVTDLTRLGEDAPPADGGGGGDDDDVPLPELQHNLRLIVDLAEAEIQTTDAKIRHEKDTRELLARERARLADDAERSEEACERLRLALTLAEKCETTARGGGGALALAQLATMYGEMRANFPETFRAPHDMADAALAHAHPLVTELFDRDRGGWDPLREPTRGAEALRPWRGVLEGSRGVSRDVDIFEAPDGGDRMTTLLTDAVIQPLRAAIATRWDVADPEPLLRFFDAWSAILPPSALNDLRANVLLPRLQSAVESWDPTRDATPIHAWTHPWLPTLGDAMRPLWAPIRHKLGNALGAWHPSDASALTALSPWRRVFDERDWESLFARCVVPKLEHALNALVINPAAQSLDEIRWVLAWEPVTPTRRMVSLLEAGFFPKWLRVLHAWLSSENPDLEEVTRWYLGWKSVFSEEILSHERVRTQLNVALDMMNQAVTGEGVRAPPTAAATAAAARDAAAAAAAAAATTKAATKKKPLGPSDAVEEMSLRDAVEAFASEHDVTFAPKPGRIVEGLQAYAFGSITVTIDSAKQMLLAQVEGRWAPVSLDALLERHKAKARKASKTF